MAVNAPRPRPFSVSNQLSIKFCPNAVSYFQIMLKTSFQDQQCINYSTMNWCSLIPVSNSKMEYQYCLCYSIKTSYQPCTSIINRSLNLPSPIINHCDYPLPKLFCTSSTFTIYQTCITELNNNIAVQITEYMYAQGMLKLSREFRS